ncbi:hypothetical protein DsansV1_C42g0239051 [Dioscorea sansibarensis]
MKETLKSCYQCLACWCLNLHQEFVQISDNQQMEMERKSGGGWGDGLIIGFANTKLYPIDSH